MKRGLIGLSGLLLIGLVIFLGPAPGWVETSLNRTIPHPPYRAGDAARAAHAQLRIMDWHADTLLWERDLLERSEQGHVDLPRLQEGNVALQMFTIVTRVPAREQDVGVSVDADMITSLVMSQSWPSETWSSLYARAQYQAERLHAASRASGGALVVIESREDLARLLEARASARESGKEPPVGGLLGIEGAHALEGELSNLDRLYELGLRMVGLHHFFDNRLGGSLSGESRAGLTPFGRSVVERAQARGMVVDVAHSSPAVVDDVLEISRAPIVVSHTGLHGQCPSTRNLEDAQLRRIAEAGGLVAIGYWKSAVCDVSPEGIVAALRYAIDLLGEDHVALGSDFDGTIVAPFHAGELAILTEHMQRSGFTPTEIRKVMGENAIALLRAQLPSEAAP